MHHEEYIEKNDNLRSNFLFSSRENQIFTTTIISAWNTQTYLTFQHNIPLKNSAKLFSEQNALAIRPVRPNTVSKQPQNSYKIVPRSFCMVQYPVVRNTPVLEFVPRCNRVGFLKLCAFLLLNDPSCSSCMDII